MDDKASKEFEEWLATRPPIIQELARKIPPDKLYRLKTSGHRVFLYSYSEDGTCTVIVSGQFNLVTFERRVFGIKPEDLEECDPPGPDEPVGTMLTEDNDVKQFIEMVKTSETINGNT